MATLSPVVADAAVLLDAAVEVCTLARAMATAAVGLGDDDSVKGSVTNALASAHMALAITLSNSYQVCDSCAVSVFTL